MNVAQPVKMFRPGDPGYTGTIASLAASTHAYVCVDLGLMWNIYSLIQVIVLPVAPMGATNTVTVYGGDQPVSAAADLLVQRVLGIPGAATPSQAKFTNLAPATGAQAIWVRPAGQYLAVDFFNQDATNAAGATSAITFVAYNGA